MKTYRTTISRLIVAGLLFGLMGMCSVSVAEEAFTKTDYESFRDNVTGLEWGKDIGVNSHTVYAEDYVPYFYNDPDDTPGLLAPIGYRFSGPLVLDGNGDPVFDPEIGEYQRIMYTDWRLPTVGELLVAFDHGLLDRLIPDFSYADGDQVFGAPIDGNDPTGPAWGDDEYWTICIERYQGLNRRYKYIFTPEGLDYWMQSGGGRHIAVRGGDPDHSNCPGKHYKPAKGGKGGKPPK